MGGDLIEAIEYGTVGPKADPKEPPEGGRGWGGKPEAEAPKLYPDPIGKWVLNISQHFQLECFWI